MKFFGHGVVWDAENIKVLCRFGKGELEVEDKRTIDILKDLGYEHDGVIEEDMEYEIEDNIDLNDKTVVELREMAKLAGYTGIYSKTKDELISMIEGD